MTTKPVTLSELRMVPGYAHGTARRSVKDELRANILQKLESGEPLFPGIYGYEETVLPQIQVFSGLDERQLTDLAGKVEFLEVAPGSPADRAGLRN